MNTYLVSAYNQPSVCLVVDRRVVRRTSKRNERAVNLYISYSCNYVPFGGSAQKVIIWTDHGRNVHCTTNLNRESWETTKS